MNNFNAETLETVLECVKDAVIFLDDASAEVLHWCNGFSKCFEAGALDIRDIKHSKECLESETKSVFLISTPVNGQIWKFIQRIVQSSDFSSCVIISTLSQEVNEFFRVTSNQINVFEQSSRILKLWMQKEFATTTVCYVPLSFITLIPELFIMPTHNNLFPVLPSDVARLQAFLHSRGDKRFFSNLGDVDIAFLPRNMQGQIKMLSSSLNSMFEAMNVHEDCYAVGYFSRLIATELANIPDARGRRKMASSRASIVFVDRTLDLVAPMSHTSDCVLDTIYEILPRLKKHNNDVAVDMKMLFGDGNVTPTTLFPGCLAHLDDKETMSTLDELLMKSKKGCIGYVIDRLKGFLKEQNIPCDVGDSKTIQTLKNLLAKFKNNIHLFKKYGGFLQCAVAVVNALTDKENDHLEELLSAEKVIMLDMAAGEGDPFAQILHLLSRKDCKRFSVVDALMFCLFIYSAGDDVSNMSPAYEEKLKEALINILMDGEHKEDLLFLIGDLDASERQIRTRIADIFERLRGIGEARKEMQILRSLVTRDGNGVMKYKPILSQIVERIFHPSKPDLVDIEFRSHGFKDFLKTGFGFFMNVSKPRPDDHPLIILFVVGGITWYEVRCVKEILRKLNPQQKVLIGSTKLLSPSDTMEQVLCSENLFVDIDT